MVLRRVPFVKAVRAGRLARRKGGAYERFVTKRFREVYGEGVKRGIGQERSGGEVADVRGVPGFWVQTKHCKSLNVWAALEQARAELAASPCACPASPIHQVKKDHTDECAARRPLVVARKDRGGDVAVLAFDDLLWLLQQLAYAEKEAPVVGTDMPAIIGNGVAISPPADTPTVDPVCSTCGKPYQKDAPNQFCSNAFHCCRDCRWEDGYRTMRCADHAILPSADAPTDTKPSPPADSNRISITDGERVKPETRPDTMCFWCKHDVPHVREKKNGRLIGCTMCPCDAYESAPPTITAPPADGERVRLLERVAEAARRVERGLSRERLSGEVYIGVNGTEDKDGFDLLDDLRRAIAILDAAIGERGR